MRNILIIFSIGFLIGHYWKHIVDFIKQYIPKKK